MPSRSWASRAAAGVLIAAAAVASGCDTGGGAGDENEFVTVYVSAPLRGPSGADGHDVADGARLALADAGARAGKLEVRARFLDASGGGGTRARWTPAKAAANARAAIEDSTAIAYVGDFESGATRASLPVTNEARMLQVSPASTAVDLVAPFAGTNDLPDVQSSGERTFGRVVPSDVVQAEAAAVWAERLGARRVATISDASEFGESVTGAFAAAARDLGLRTTRLADRSGVSCPLARPTYAGAQAGNHADLVVAPAATAAGPGRVPLLVTDAVLKESRTLGVLRCEPALRIVSGAVHPRHLPPAGREFAASFSDEYGRPPGRYAAYGYEAMAVVLDAIERAGDEGAVRDAVVDAFLETADRDSILGTYSIDEVGETTLDRVSGYRIAAGSLRPVAELTPP